MRLIDADELKKWLKSPVGFRANCEDCTSIDCLNCIIEEAIDNAPTIEAAPVVHGRWMIETSTHGPCGYVTHYCDHCNDFFTPDAEVMYFCPNCGAKMIAIERDEVFLSLDEKRIRAFCKKWKINVPENDLAFWAGVHKTICNLNAASVRQKTNSLAWLLQHGFKPEIGSEG